MLLNALYPNNFKGTALDLIGLIPRKDQEFGLEFSIA
jgi:hypothetical protein